MLQGHSAQAYSDGRFAVRYGKPAVSAQHSPRENRLLAALHRKDYERLLPDLRLVPLPIDCAIHDAAGQERFLHFVTAGIVAKVYRTQNGTSTGFAITGNEGVMGIASVLGGDTTPSQAVVLSAGYAYRLGVGLLKREFERTVLLPALLRYTQALITQTGQIAVCNRHHEVEQQLCRWILSCLDRLPSHELAMTQELLADMLGVRREGVTEAAGRLQKAGVIRYSRGHIVVLNRSRLEARVCECYAVVKREYDRLLPEYWQGEFA